MLLGLSHLAIQLPAGILLGDFAWSYIEWWASPWLRMVASGVMGSLSTCFIMGLYLMICTKWLDLHHNEAFTALRLTIWKNFLRIQLSSGKMTVYAVGLDKIGDEPERNRPILIDEFEL